MSFAKSLAFAVFVMCATGAWSGAGAEEAKPLKEHDVEQIAIKLANETVQGGYRLLNVSQLKAMLDAKEDFVLIDAHPKWEFDLGYVAGATNFGFKSVRAART